MAFNMTNLKQNASVVDEECGISPLPSPNNAPDLKEPFGNLRPKANEKHLNDFHWMSPIKMVSFLLFGILMSLGHHFYYQLRAGKAVGNDIDQQNDHRFVFNFNEPVIGVHAS